MPYRQLRGILILKTLGLSRPGFETDLSVAEWGCKPLGHNADSMKEGMNE